MYHFPQQCVIELAYDISPDISSESQCTRRMRRGPPAPPSPSPTLYVFYYTLPRCKVYLIPHQSDIKQVTPANLVVFTVRYQWAISLLTSLNFSHLIAMQHTLEASHLLRCPGRHACVSCGRVYLWCASFFLTISSNVLTAFFLFAVGLGTMILAPFYSLVLITYVHYYKGPQWVSLPLSSPFPAY